jgi:hypothetical protein
MSTYRLFFHLFCFQLNILVWYKAYSIIHGNITCSRHDIAENVITHLALCNITHSQITAYELFTKLLNLEMKSDGPIVRKFYSLKVR